MASTFKTYRHDLTGVVSVEPVAAAKHQPHLHEVEEDAKPLAYLPIPEASIDSLRAPDWAAVGDRELNDDDDEGEADAQ